MELHAMNWMILVAQRHDQAIAGGGGGEQPLGKLRLQSHQGVVPSRLKGIANALKQGAVIVTDDRGLSMDGQGSAADDPSIRHGDGLMLRISTMRVCRNNSASLMCFPLDCSYHMSRPGGLGDKWDALAS